MDIYLFNSQTTERIQIPVIPSEIKLKSDQSIDAFETIGQGELMLIGIRKARTLSFDSFFPSKDYPFNKNKNMYGMEYCQKIEVWRSLRKPFYISISGITSFLCTVDSFEYGQQDGSGDIYYTLQLTEYRVPNIQTVKPKPSEIKTTQNQAPAPLQNSFGVVTAGNGLNIRSGAGIGYKVVKAVPKGTKLKLYRLENGWWQVDGGWCSAQYIKKG